MSGRAKTIKYAMVIFALISLFAFTGSAFAQCNPAYTYVALQTALDAMASDAQVNVTTRTVAGWSDPNYYYEFIPASGTPTEAFIIYPGACLDARAYAVVAHTIAASGYLVAIVPMPGYLAINGQDRADAVISNHPEIIKWSIGGHSFGGVGACWYLTGGYTYSNKINGIVLWASYPDAAQPINTYPVKVISIWGTNDAYTTSAKIDGSKPNLPTDTHYVALQGANHSQFGAYGFSTTDYTFVQPKPNPGDNPAAITRQQQTDLIVQYTLSFLNSLTPANVPAALETIIADDGSTWERVNAPGFGNNDNKCVVALSGYNGRLYAATRNDVSGFELWRTNGTGWEKLNVSGLTDQNGFYGYILPWPWEGVDIKKFNLMQNIWGDMIVYNGYLYLAIETGYQGNILYGSVGCQIWRFSEAGGWEPVVADANASIISGAINTISGCADADGDTTAQITISDAAGYATNHFAGDILKVEALFTDNTPGMRVFTIISSDTTGTLTIQEQDFSGNGGYTGYTVCAEHTIEGDPGRPSSIIPAITTGSIAHIIMTSPDVSGFGEIWNKSIVDLEIFNGDLYATIGLNYLYGARVWKTSNGTTWVPNSNYSFGLFHGYYPDGYPNNPTGICWHNTVTERNGNPVCSSFTKFGKSSVTGTETLFTGGTGTGGCNGSAARVARLDGNQWNLIVDYFVDTNTTGTNENGLGDDAGGAFNFSNFQAWSFAEYDNKLFNAIARFKGGRMMYTATGSNVDGAWTYAVGGGASTTEGIGDVTNIGFNLYNYKSTLYAGSFSTVAFLPGLTINGADIWKGTGPGNNLTWTRITGNAFGDTNAVEAGAFTEFYGTLYVALSTTLPANFPGEELPGAGGAKIYRLQVPPVTTTTTTAPVTTTTTVPPAAQCADQYPSGKPYILYAGSNLNCPFADWGLVNYFQHIVPFPADIQNIEYYATVNLNGATGCIDLRVVIENNYGAAQYFNGVTDGQSITINVPRTYFENTNFDGCSTNWFVHTADIGWQFQPCGGGWLGTSIISSPLPGCNLNLNTCCPDATCCTPTAITLSSFTAKGAFRMVILQWQTASEIDNAGFNIYRSDAEEGEYIKINSTLIMAQGSSTQGAAYSFTDRGLKNRTTYFYKLEDVDVSGSSTFHGPVSAAPSFLASFK